MHDTINSTHTTPQLPRTANERMEMSSCGPPVEPLFDSFWHTRELALLFGAAGTGKSMLAMLLAERLARGKGIEGFVMPERRRKVLYVDLKLSDTQFGLRYSDPETERDYRFSNNLYIESPPSIEQLVPWLRDMVAAGIDVIIIDDLSAVQQAAHGTKHTLRLMRNLRELIYEKGVSVLVIAGSRPHRYNASVDESDLLRSRVLCDVADSVFGIGHHPHYTGSQYVQQTRSRTMPIYWDHTAPPRFTIQRSDDGFIGPEFDERFAEQLDEETARLIYQLKKLHDNGRSIRQIAKDLGTSKSRVERLLKKWTPDIGRYFDQLLDDPSDDDGPDDEFDEETEHAEPEHESAAHADDQAPDSEEFDHATTEAPISTSEGVVALDDPAADANDSDPDPNSQLSTINSQFGHLRHTLDAYGRDIWIESEDNNGKPMLWFRYDSNNRLCRMENKGYFITTTRVEDFLHCGPELKRSVR